MPFLRVETLAFSQGYDKLNGMLHQVFMTDHFRFDPDDPQSRLMAIQAGLDAWVAINQGAANEQGCRKGFARIGSFLGVLPTYRILCMLWVQENPSQMPLVDAHPDLPYVSVDHDNIGTTRVLE